MLQPSSEVGLVIEVVINPGEFCDAVERFTALATVLSDPVAMLVYVNAFKLVPSAVTEIGCVSGTPQCPAEHVPPRDSIYVAIAICGASIIVVVPRIKNHTSKRVPTLQQTGAGDVYI